MRIGVNFFQNMHLIHIKIPKCLSDFIQILLRILFFGKFRKMNSRHPVHCDDFLTRIFRIIMREFHIRKMTAFFCKMLTSFQFQIIVSFFKQFVFHFLKIRFRTFLFDVEHFHRNRFYHFQVARNAFSYTGILYFHRQFFAVFFCSMNLSDTRGINRFGGKFIKNIFRIFPEIFSEGFLHQSTRQRRNGKLRK